ncbi:TPA: hypothetical protein ACMDP8_000084 [Vibrio cholerae]|nr:hypothetical protein [Vibrio cholerae]EKF9166420.1 hypothetical protein [Vibrio cholerae]
MNTLKVKTEKGHVPVPAIFIEGVDGLAITMSGFGLFEVTHTKSGYMIIGRYERFANALVEMLSLYLAMKEAGINFDVEVDEFKCQVKKAQNQSQYLNDLTIISYLQVMKPIIGLSGEFPWESCDEGPHADIEKLMKKINEVNTMGAA